MNPRTCIVTRQEQSAQDMIRFVVDPEGNVVPDLKAKLPGRGAWVSMSRELVAKAVKRNLFARVFAKPVAVSPNLPELVLKLLRDEVSRGLSMANKAGLVISGFSKVDAAIRNGKAALLLHVENAAEDGKRKLRSANSATVLLGGPEVEIFELQGTDIVERALGNNSLVHIAVKHGGAADSLRSNIVRLNSYNTAPQKPDEH